MLKLNEKMKMSYLSKISNLLPFPSGVILVDSKQISTYPDLLLQAVLTRTAVLRIPFAASEIDFVRQKPLLPHLFLIRRYHQIPRFLTDGFFENLQ